MMNGFSRFAFALFCAAMFFFAFYDGHACYELWLHDFYGLQNICFLYLTHFYLDQGLTGFEMCLLELCLVRSSGEMVLVFVDVQ